MTKQIKIEKGIPIPKSTRKACIYPFYEMEIGDSFADTWNGTTAIMTLAKKYIKEDASGKKFITRRKDGMIRCWRIKYVLTWGNYATTRRATRR